METHEQEIHLKDYIKIIMKHRWTVLTCFMVIVTLVAIVSFRQTPVYRATAQLQIEKDNPNVLSIQEVMELDAGQTDYYQTQYKILQSRSLARGVINKLGLDQKEEFDPDLQEKGLVGTAVAAVKALFGNGDEPAAGDDKRRATRILNVFLEKISIEPLRNTRLVKVNAESFDPELAMDMANALSSLYIEQNLNLKLDTTSQAGEWLSERALEARAKLDEAEKALQAYKERHKILSLDERQNFMVQKLEELNTELTRARTSRIEAQTRFNQLGRAKREQADVNYESMPQVIGNRLIQDYKAELVKLQGELAELSKTYTPKHPRIIGLVSQVKTMQERINEEIDRVIQGIRNEYEVAQKREESLQTALEEQKAIAQGLNQKAIEYGVLEREVETTRQIFDMLSSRSKETDLAGGLRTSNIRLVDKAEVPLKPIRPKKARNVVLAIIVGLMTGVGVAFFIEYLDDTIKDPDDLERHVHLPFLGPVPIHKPSKKIKGARDMITVYEPKSLSAEAYRAVRTSLLFTSPDDPPKTLVLTSPGPQEGKSVTAMNLALALAGSGKNVLLVDADMRKPRIHRTFGVDNSRGLSTIISGEDDAGKAIHKTKSKNLSILPSGPIPPNPAEMLGTTRMKKLIELLAERFDMVLFDCTPLIAVTDATILASRVDGVVLVVKQGATGRHILQRGKKQLEDVKANIIGVVLNYVDVRKSTYYYSTYYSQNYYGEDNGKSNSRQKKNRSSVKA